MNWIPDCSGMTTKTYRMKQLTKAEEEVMQLLWKIKKGNVAAILEDKGFVSHEKVGKGHVYFPLVQKSEYSNQRLNTLMEGYFQGSFSSMVSFFMKKNDISLKELEDIMKNIKDKKK